MLRELRGMHLVELHRLRHARALALLGNPRLDGQALQALTKQADEAADAIQAALLPWAETQAESERSRLAAQWKDVYGDPDSPGTRAAIAATVAWLEAHTGGAGE